MTSIECLVYASVYRRLTATADEVAADLKITLGQATLSLDSLVAKELLYRIGNGYRSWTFKIGPKRPVHGSLGPSEETLSPERVDEEQKPKASSSVIPSRILSDHRAAARARESAQAGSQVPAPFVVTRLGLLNAEELSVQGSPWTKGGIAGRFIRRWEERYGIEYKPATSYARDLWCAEQILAAEGELAVWVVEALFDKALDWATSKDLEFAANRSHRNRHLRQVAVTLVGRYQPPRADGQQVQAEVHIPGAKK